VSSNRAQILALARRVGVLWRENSRIVTRPMEESLDELAALSGTGANLWPEKVAYMVLRDDWKPWMVEAANAEDAVGQFIVYCPGEGYRGVYRDSQLPAWAPERIRG
jgi:hypothetical protein